MASGRRSRRRQPSSLASFGYGLVTDTIVLTVPSGPRGAGVAALVLGGLGSRLDLPVDRIDAVALATSTLGASASGGELEIEMTVDDKRLLVRVGPLGEGTGEDPGRRRVVEPLVDGVAVLRRAGHEWVELELLRGVTG